MITDSTIYDRFIVMIFIAIILLIILAKDIIVKTISDKRSDNKNKKLISDISPVDTSEAAYSKYNQKMLMAIAIIFISIGSLIIDPSNQNIKIFAGLIILSISILIGIVEGILGFVITLAILVIIFWLIGGNRHIAGAYIGLLSFIIFALFIAEPLIVKPLFRYQNVSNKNLVPYIWIIAVVSLILSIIIIFNNG